MNVYIKRINNLNEDLTGLLELLSWEEVITPDDTVLIKPNFCTDELANGVTTNLDVIRALAGVLKDRAELVVVGETRSNWNNLEKWVHRLDLGCDIVNLSKTRSHVLESPFGSLKLPEIIFEAKLINLPVLKTHVLTKVTLGIKNLFGLLQNKDKDRYHDVIHELLLYLSEVVKPDLNIMDATFSMLRRGGPTDGKVFRTDLILGSRDVVALDMAACRFYGLDPGDVRHIRLVRERVKIRPQILGDSAEWKDLTTHLT